jgi:peptidoglycan/LPS O-acetylase OafA/YrhL
LQNFVYHSDAGPFLQPTWSLAVEEQFYFLWPLVVLKCSPKTSAYLSGICFVASPAIRFVAYHLSHSAFLEFNTICRLDSIALGCLIALLRSGALGLRLDWQRIGRCLIGFWFLGSIPCLLTAFAHSRIGCSLGFSFSLYYLEAC